MQTNAFTSSATARPDPRPAGRTGPSATASPVVNALSVDVEEWFQVGAFETCIDRADWDTLESRVEANTGRVLDLFAQAGVRGTFFTLGWVAARKPALIRRIVDAGHELASHGWDHKRVHRMGALEFGEDLKRARQTLEDAGGVAVTGYRAPSFSIDARTPWAHPILAEQGYAYSSSVAPVAHDHYGWPDAPRFAFRPLADDRLIELPVATVSVAVRRTVAGGGGFLRMLPYRFSRWALRSLNGEGRPAAIYFHPWEVDPDQPRVAHAPLRSRIRHYSRLHAMEGKVARLLSDFRWDRTDRVVAAEAARLP